MFEKSKKYFAQIQKSDEKTRRRYIFIFSTVASVIVIIFWIFYLATYTITPVEHKPPSSTSSNLFATSTLPLPPTKKSSPSFFESFWSTFKKGLNQVGNEIKNDFLYLQGKIKAGLEFLESIFNKKRNLELKNNFPLQDYFQNYEGH